MQVALSELFCSRWSEIRERNDQTGRTSVLSSNTVFDSLLPKVQHRSVIALPVTTNQLDSLVSTFFRSTRI